MKRLYVMSVAIVALVCACNPSPKPADDSSVDDDQPVLQKKDASATTAVKPKDRGDVEQRIYVETFLAPESELPNIGRRELRDGRPKLNLVELRVNPPYPAQLLFDVVARSPENWENSPVALRIKVFLDGVEIDSMLGKVGPTPPGDHIIARKTIDILQHIEELKPSMLLYAQAEAVLMPEGTPFDSVDPATATSSPDRMTTVLGNPVRINVIGLEDEVPNEATDPDAAPAAETPSEPAGAGDANAPAPEASSTQ